MVLTMMSAIATKIATAVSFGIRSVVFITVITDHVLL